MLDKLPAELICHIIVSLNGGAIDDTAEPECGFLYPGYRGGRELHYFKISRDCMTLWQHVCKYLRHAHEINSQAYNMLLANTTPQIEMWNDPYDIDEQWEDYACERYVPRHLYAGSPKPWMRMLCDGPQTLAEVEAEVAAKEARKEKRRADAAIALVEGWGSCQRRLRSRK